MDGTWGRIAGKVREDSFCRIGERSEFGFVVWSYSLGKEVNLILKCGVTVWRIKLD